jgi:hypothetical protein
MTYDAGRGAVVIALVHPTQSSYATELDRYTYDSGTASWSAATTVSLAGIGAMALSADGSKLLVGTLGQTAAPTCSINEVDPVALTAQLTASTGSLGPPTHIAVLNDGRALITQGQNALDPVMSYTELQPQLVPLEPYQTGTGLVYNGVVAASGDGSIATIIDGLSGQFMQWNASTETLAPPQNSSGGYWASLSVDGSRQLMVQQSGTQIYDASYNAVGALPSTTLIGVVAPSGQRAYTYDSNGTIRVFDLTTPATGTTPCPEILPAITLAASPSTNPVGPYRMTITPDGGTLFIAGDKQIVVVPLP